MKSLSRNPFSMSPDPGLFYFSYQHVECLQTLETGLRIRSGLSVVLGDVGTGKTTVSRILIRLFQEKPEYIFRMILDPQFASEEEFVTHLIQLFEVKTTATTLLDRKEALQEFLFFKGLHEKKIPVLLIDEGQKLTPAMMEIIRGLLNYETNEFKLVQVVIFGQLELAQKIRTMPNFLDRIASSYVLKPLTEYELIRMLDYRVRRCGYRNVHELFTDRALSKVYERSNGFPRRAINLCHQAMMVKLNEELDIIDEDVLTHNIRHKEMAYV